MKNLINYYYNIIMTEIRKHNDVYVMQSNGIEYEFLPININDKELYEIYNILLSKNIYCHELIYNYNNSIVTYYEYIPYVLIKKNIYSTDLITLEDIFNYDISIFKSFKINWKRLWEEKIDYYEYQVKEIGVKYSNIRKSFNYYIGLSECAISLLNYLNNDNIELYISHKRIALNNTIDEFINPINIMIDSRIRDIGEYIKINYINGNINIDNVFGILNRVNLNFDESILLLSRLLYPSYYFDLYDEIIKEKLDESKLDVYIEKNTYFEAFLKDVYNYLKLNFKLPEIEWLNY